MSPRQKLIYEAIRFAHWAAGEGLSPAPGEPAESPEIFLMDYTVETDDEFWETLAERISAADAVVAPEGWRPIETAPKDGRDFLVWNWENRIRKARWYERADNDLGISLYDSDGVNTFKGGIQPTHWMPLPQAPSPSEAKEP